MALFKFCLLLLMVINYCHCAKILGVFHMPAPSHYILGSALMKGLAEAGHDVTVISAYGEKNVPKHWKYRDIVLDGFGEEIEAAKKDMFNRAGGSPFFGSVFLSFMGSSFADQALNYTVVQDLLKSGEKFDVVIVEQFVNDAFKALGPHFGASVVVLNTIPANLWINPLVGNPSLPAYIPDMSINYAPGMNFLQRTYNTVITVYNWLVLQWVVAPLQNRIVNKYFPHVDDWVTSGKYNVSLVLVNSHVSMSQPMPLNPNMIEIGGYHLQPPEKLPKDLQDFMDNAKEGVVYFSMGSNLKSKYLPAEKKDAILKAFSKLKCKVLWKWEDDVLPGKPNNVMVKKWLPQQSILAHPNVKLFITHGGLLSTTEAIYHGVPIVAIPIFGDQASNAARAVINGYGIEVAYNELKEETFYKSIMEALSNRKYAENAKTRSKLMHDRPMKPLDTAIYWIEYVVRHKGATHFRSAALDLTWYQYLLLDVIAFLAIVALGVIYSIKLIVCSLRGRKTKSGASETEKKDKKKSKKTN